MILGITGTKEGFSKTQFAAFKTVLATFIAENDVTVFCQGQCTGVDVEAADWVHRSTQGKVKIQSHPPIKTQFLGESHVDYSLKPKNYFARNRDIADIANVLFVCPLQETEQDHGGTWYTYKYANEKGKKIVLITPSGKISYLNF